MRNVIAWIVVVTERATDSNKIEVIVLGDQKSRELRRIRTPGLAVYLCDCSYCKYTRECGLGETD